MNFKEWFILNERPYASLQYSGDSDALNQKRISIIDLRAEDWIASSDSIAEKLKPRLQAMMPPPPAFYGRMPSGDWIHFDGSDMFNYKVTNVKPSLGIDLDNLEGLEGYWWDYTIGWDEDGDVVKRPIRIRQFDLAAEV